MRLGSRRGLAAAAAGVWSPVSNQHLERCFLHPRLVCITGERERERERERETDRQTDRERERERYYHSFGSLSYFLI